MHVHNLTSPSFLKSINSTRRKSKLKIITKFKLHLFQKEKRKKTEEIRRIVFIHRLFYSFISKIGFTRYK